MPIEKLEARMQALQTCDRTAEQALMYPSCPRYRVYAVSLPSFLRSTLAVETELEFCGSAGAEVVSAADYIAPVRVRGGIEAGEEGEHFGCVAAAAEDDEEVCGCAAFSGVWACVVGGGEDVEETELGGGGLDGSVWVWGGEGTNEGGG